ncbi:MAG: hypothetical protein LBP26_02645 [Clostridiales bacterium]|jgi:cell division septum initiation protein DivIVA|nr:hypothetical protein [Clostridiales bacterium]
MDFNIEKRGYSPAEVDEYIRSLRADYERTLAAQKERIFEQKAALDKAEKTIAAYKEKSGLVTKAIYNAVAKAEEIERLSVIKYGQEIARLKAFHEKWMSYYNKMLEKYLSDDDLAAAAEFNRRMQSVLDRSDPASSPNSGGGAASADAALRRAFASETERLKEKQIGYIKVRADSVPDGGADPLKDMLPGADLNSPIVTGDFDPIERINRYFSSDAAKKSKREHAAALDPDEYADRSDSGFSFEEALNPKEDLAQIMRDLGLLLEEN